MVFDSFEYPHDGPDCDGIQTSVQNQAESLITQYIIITFDFYHVYKTALTCGMSISISFGYPYY